jgi:hypothetical protein
VVFEVLNRAEPMTFVFTATGPDGLPSINRALDDAGFQTAALQAGGLATPARPADRSGLLAASLTGQVPHDADWPGRLALLLSG